MTKETRTEARPLAGLRVIIAEDDVLIGVHLEDQLTDAGAEVIGFAASLREAEALAGRGDGDGAILDINLGGEMIYPVARILRDRGMPFVFLTGYGAASIPREFAQEATLQKPCDFDELVQMISHWG